MKKSVTVELESFTSNAVELRELELELLASIRSADLCDLKTFERLEAYKGGIILLLLQAPIIPKN